MTDQRDIIAALSKCEQFSLTQISERTKIFRQTLRIEIEKLVAAGVVVRETEQNESGTYQRHLYSLPEAACADPA